MQKEHIVDIGAMFLVKRSRMTVVILSIVYILKLAVSEIVIPPKDVDAVLGTSAFFNCSSSILEADVQWVHSPIDRSAEAVYGYGKFSSQYANRFTLVDGYNLRISSVTVDDAGTYECQDDYGQGEKRSAELVVLESNPTCRSNSNSDKIVGKNTCGIEPGRVTLTCSVQYQGKKPPTLEWKQIGEEKTITSGVSNEIRGSRLLHNLTLKGDSFVNGSSYSCRSAKATSTAVACNSDSITITGQDAECESCYNYVVAIICICTVALPISLAFSFLIRIRLLNIIKKCQRLKAEKEVLLNRFQDHIPTEKAKCADKPELIFTITTDEPLKKRQPIYGLAVLGNELFVAHEMSSEIVVYNTITHHLQRTLQLPNIKELYDLVAGMADNCLFALILPKQAEGRPTKKEDRNEVHQRETEDAKDEESKHMIKMEIVADDMQDEEDEYVIIKFDVKGHLLLPWSKPSGVKYGKLSTCESNVIICFNTVKEFSREGDLIREVLLPQLTRISCLWRAIKVTRLHYAVSYGDEKDDLHGICLVDFNGNIKMKCRGLEKEPSYNRPVYFIEDRYRSLLVADQWNYRILLLDWNLKFQRILIQLGYKQYPVRLCFDETQSKLFVSIHSGVVDDKGKVKNARVLVFNTNES